MPTVHWKHRLFAAMLGIAMPGLGQLYGGQQKKGLWVYAIVMLLAPFGMLAVWGLAPAEVVFPFLLLAAAGVLGCLAWSVADAAWNVNPNSEQAYFVGTPKQRLGKVALALVLYGGMLLNPFDALRENRFHVFIMSSGTMAPVLELGDRFFVNLQAYGTRGPQLGDIVTVRPVTGNDHTVVRQLAGLPGQDVVLLPKTIAPEGLQLPAEGQPLTLPQGFIYVRAVNPEFPFAAIMPVGLLQGRVEYIFWPPSRLGAVSGAGHLPIVGQ